MKIVIEGAGEVGSHLAKMLSNASHDITIIDSDESRLQNIKSCADVITLQGDSSSISVLKEAGVGNADLFIAVNPFTKQDVNIVSAIISKRLGCQKVCSRIDDQEYLHYENKYMFTEMGIDYMFYPEKIAANEISSRLKKSIFNESLDFAGGKLQMSSFRIEEDSPLLEMNMAEFAAVFSNTNVNFRVVAISREETTIIPNFDTHFQYHDLIYIITKRECTEKLFSFFHKTPIKVRKVMILGGSQIGKMVANNISKEVDEVRIIEKDLSKCAVLREATGDNVTIIHGDGRNSDFLLDEGLKECEAFVAVTGNDEANMLACVVAKRYGVSKTIAEVENIEYIHIAENLGVDVVINKKQMTAGKIYKMILSNKVRFIKYMADTQAEILEYIVAPDSKITRNKLKDMKFPKNAIIGGIIRGKESMIAIGDTQIEEYDRVAVFALPNAVSEVDKFFK